MSESGSEQPGRDYYDRMHDSIGGIDASEPDKFTSSSSTNPGVAPANRESDTPIKINRPESLEPIKVTRDQIEQKRIPLVKITKNRIWWNRVKRWFGL